MPEPEVKYDQTGLWLVFPFRVSQTVKRLKLPKKKF
jgi:hypothetical protein